MQVQVSWVQVRVLKISPTGDPCHTLVLISIRGHIRWWLVIVLSVNIVFFVRGQERGMKHRMDLPLQREFQVVG
jgi:hypothetical protein